MESSPVTLRIGERWLLSADLSRTLEQKWEKGTSYSLGDFVRPKAPNGFEYECTNPGQSDNTEPQWPTVIGGTHADGSVEWTCRDMANSATDTVDSALITTDGAGTIGAQTVGATMITFEFTATDKALETVTVAATTVANELIKSSFRVTKTV